MDEIIKIKCPNDGAILSIKNQPGLEKKNVTCPICKQSRPFTEYFKVVAKQEEHTEYPEQNTGDDDTTTVEMGSYIIGRLTDTATGKGFQLRLGNNIVGRKAASSNADFQIDTGDKRRMSRQQVVIEVKKVKGKGIVHQVKLYKEKCNATFINTTQLEAGDCIVLHHGDVLRLPDANVRFEIPDADATEL